MSILLPRMSVVAERYASSEIGGIIMRAALKPKARTIGEDQNRAERAGITDFGTYAAALGCDAVFINGAFTYCQERMWVVLNRGELVIQKHGLEYAGIRTLPAGQKPHAPDPLFTRLITHKSE